MRNILHKKRITIINKFILCIVLSLILLLPTSAVSITTNPSITTSINKRAPISTLDTLIVDDDGTGDYTTIQAAINNASPGDHIIVKDGIYGDQLTINVSNLTISAAGGETPTIYVGAYTVGINVTASDIFLQGFEIYGNGETTGGPYPTIRASSGSSDLSVINNTIRVFTGQRGQLAILITADVQRITISTNIIHNYTTGVLMQENSQAEISEDNVWYAITPIYHAARLDNGSIYYGSIQSAINHTEIGHTVNVLVGTFMENIIIDRPLTLNGLQAGFNPNEKLFENQSVIQGTTTHAISITPGTSQVTIDGFLVTIANKSNSSRGAGILVGMNTNDITIKNNIIQNITDGPGIDTLTDETYGIMVYGRDPVGGQTHISIRNNLIQNVEEYGIAINDKTSEVTIQGNVIKNLIGSNHSDFPDPSWPSWICAAIHLGGQVGPIVNVTILENTLSTNTTGNGSTSPAGGGISFAGVTEWTNFSNIWKGFKGITITNNLIYNNTMGIISLTGIFKDIPSIHHNNISRNTKYGIKNNLSTNFNATNNWWGTTKGPYHSVLNPNGTGNQVSNYVLISPWSRSDDFTPPEITITQPQPGIYIMSFRVTSRFFYPLIFGPIKVKVDARDSKSGINKIEFYTKYHGGTALAQTIYDVPYEWFWNEKIFGFYDLEVIAYDNAGLTATAEIHDVFLVMFGFLAP